MIPYNPERYATGLGFLRIIFALRGTVIPHVVKSGIFWFTLVSHAVFHVVEFLWSGLDISDYSWSGLASSDTASRDKLPRLPWEVGTASLTLCIFFLVFYTNSMHQRFQEFHSHVIGIGGHTMVWVGLVRMHLVPSPRVAAAGSTAAAREEVANRTWNAVRHVLGAMQVFYYTINSTGVRYKELDLQGVDDFEWQTMIERGVVGAREARWLARYAGFKPWLLLSWGLVEVGTQIDGLAASAPAGADATSAREALRRRVLAGLVEEFRASACALRFHMGQINALREMQTPFPYFHMLNLLLVLNLLLLAYISVPLCAWPLSSFIVTIMAIYLLGMRAIAIKLADDPMENEDVAALVEKFKDKRFGGRRGARGSVMGSRSSVRPARASAMARSRRESAAVQDSRRSTGQNSSERYTSSDRHTGDSPARNSAVTNFVM